MLFRRKVIHGQKEGRKIGYPTLNFHVGSFGEYHDPGVYACDVKINGVSHRGGLYYGPKPGFAAVLEIHVLSFSGNVYGQWVSFHVGKKIRPPKKIATLPDLKKQIAEDLQQVLYS